MHDRDTLKGMLEPGSGDAGAVNPASQHLDFYSLGPAKNKSNYPDREVFVYFFAMRVTWQ